MQENNYLLVNWVDGMKINKNHFIAQENALLSQIAQNTNCLLNELSYGILPSANGHAELKLFITTDSQRRLQVRVQQCRAVTYGGYYIEFNEDTALHGNNLIAPVVSAPSILRDLKARGNHFYIVLSINPYKRIPYGTASNETPPRIPFTLPALSVDLIPVEEVTRNLVGPLQLPVGKMSIDDQRVFLEEDYIPPCTAVASHPELLEIQAGIEQFYSKMELYSLQIIQKILQKKQSNDMSVIVQRLCENILSFTAVQLAELKSYGIIQPPVTMVSKLCSLARIMKNTVDCFIGSGKEELVNYVVEWCNIKQGELEGALATLATHQYDHMDINESIGIVAHFTKLVSKLFHQLARLEYIGKKKESGIFVKEELVLNEQAPRQKRRSFLAD